MGLAALLGFITFFGAAGVEGPPSPESPILSPLRFERVVIDPDFPGGYQVEVADVNGDKKPDIVALGGSTLAWYENPTWKKRVVSTAKQTPDIISSATADLDGDGKAEIAIACDFAMNEPRRGKLLLAIQGATSDDPWTFKPIVEDKSPRYPGDGAAVGGGFAGGGVVGGPEKTTGGGIAGGGTTGGAGGFGGGIMTNGVGGSAPPPPAPEPPGGVPSIHRLRWGKCPSIARVNQGSVTFEIKPALFVAPLFGRSATPPDFGQEPARLRIYETGPDPKSAIWRVTSLGQAPVLHAIEVFDFESFGGISWVLVASNLGITHHRGGDMVPGPPYLVHDLAPGASGVAPKKGASEIHLGRFKDGRRFVATVEPWHGTDVAIYILETLNYQMFKPRFKLGPRTLIDSSLKEGHALWVADVDGDGDDEVFAGYRGGGGGVLMYDFDGQTTWTRTVLDPEVTAQDLRGGDLDGDGTPDVVAIGGRSHNVVWYRPIRPAK